MRGQGYFRAPLFVLFQSFLPECLVDMCPLGLAAPLVQLLDLAQDRCHGIMQGEGTSRVQVVKSDIQQNGHDCGAWSMYALYTRAQKRATRYTRAALFENMDLRCPRGALKFRYVPLPGHKPPSRPPQSRTHACLRRQPMEHSVHAAEPMCSHVILTQPMLREYSWRQPMLLYQCFLQPMYAN